MFRFTIDSHEVRRIIQQKNLKLWWVADSVGVHKTTLRRWLNGRVSWINHENLVYLAKVLEVDLKQITTTVEREKKKREEILVDRYGR